MQVVLLQVSYFCCKCSILLQVAKKQLQVFCFKWLKFEGSIQTGSLQMDKLEGAIHPVSLPFISVKFKCDDSTRTFYFCDLLILNSDFLHFSTFSTIKGYSPGFIISISSHRILLFVYFNRNNQVFRPLCDLKTVEYLEL